MSDEPLAPPLDPHTIGLVTVSEADAQRQLAWRQKSVERIRASRARRLAALSLEQRAIARAVEEYERIGSLDVPNIGLRGTFVRVGPEAEQERRALRHLRDGTADTATPEEGRERAGAAAGDVQEIAVTNPGEEQDALELDAPSEDRLARRELHSRPPSTKLLRHPTALRLLLSSIYLSQLEEVPGGYFANRRHNTKQNGPRVSWASATGLYQAPSRRARRVRIVGALECLSKYKLVRLKAGSNEDWQLLREDGADELYRLPSPQQLDLLVLPSTFFERGWHLVLTPAEIAVLLAITNLDQRIRRARGDAEVDRDGVALPQSVRFDAYGISGEAYETVHQLDEIGLIELSDPMPHRRRGKIRPATEAEHAAADETEQSLAPLPYRFKLGPPEGYNRSATEVLVKALKTYPRGRRLEELPGLMPRIL